MTVTSVPYFRPSIGDAEIEAVTGVLETGWVTTGKHARSFETEFAEAVGGKYAIALNSCTAALHLGLEALGIQRGDLVLVPALTFAATAEVVRYFDAVPVFVDSDPTTFCMCPDALVETINKIKNNEPVSGLSGPYGRLAGVIPVHYAGQMADMERIQQIADDEGLWLMEDAAHCMPAKMKVGDAWKKCGEVSKVTAFSFYANKCITTGEGGMLVTDDKDIANRVRVMSLHGMSKDAWKRFDGKSSPFYDIVAPGYKYNMTDVAASMGRVQLSRHQELWDARKKAAAYYTKAFANVDGVETPVELESRRSSWHLFVVRIKGLTEESRLALIHALQERNVATSVHYRPLHLMSYYADSREGATMRFPNVDAMWPTMLSLPLFAGITEAEQDYVVEQLIALLT